jgi:uncharacterized protein YjbI with pentapeptide repeats
MAKPKHVELLSEHNNRLVWAMNREQRPDVKPDLTDADLHGADLTEFNLSFGDFTGANLAGANLSAADLKGANFTGANLTGANLSFAECSGASFRNASFNGANLCLADGLTQEQISAAKIDQTTKLPDYLEF